MGSESYEDVSVSLSILLIKYVGIWFADNRTQRCFRNCMVFNTIFWLLFLTSLQAYVLYHSWGDFMVCTFTGYNVLSLSVVLFKAAIFRIYKQKFLNLVRFMQKHFWHTNYTPHEQAIFAKWKRTCIFFVICFFIFTDGADVSYTFIPILENIGKNASDRVLIFDTGLNLPLSTTPYFEIAFTIQVVMVFNVEVSYVCFDNFFCVINMHMAGQFRILQSRLENIRSLKTADENHEKPNSDMVKNFYNEIRNCIQRHQLLVMHSGEIEEIFSPILLAQALAFSAMICLTGYQLIMLEMELTNRIPFIAILISNMFQLFMFTYSCDCLIEESTAVSEAVYTAAWSELPMDQFGKRFRKDLQIMVMRSRRPCRLTASKFFTISMKTYSSILSTAMSYFTLLRQSMATT